MRIRTILCPIDFSDVAARELEVAVETARTFGARLVLHHNRAAISPGLARQWDWESTHHADDYDEAEAERRLQAAVAGLPRDVGVDAVASVGPIGPVVLALAERLPADLVVIGSHGWSSEDHASVTDRLIAEAPCPVLTFDERSDAALRFRLRPDGDETPLAIVPTDFSATADRALDFAWALARATPLKVHLLHVLPTPSPAAERAAEIRLDQLVPADVGDAATISVAVGDPGRTIVEQLVSRRPSFAILGEHARGILRHFMTRDTTRAVVHSATCPVMVVPQCARV